MPKPNPKLASYSPRAIQLLHWHWRELEGLLERLSPDAVGYPVVEARANELAELLGIEINYEGDEK